MAIINTLEVYYGKGYASFPTQKSSAKEAYYDYVMAADSVGIDLDNTPPTKVVLFGEGYAILDTYDFKWSDWEDEDKTFVRKGQG